MSSLKQHSLIIVLFWTMLTTSVLAQDYEAKNFKWAENPTWQALSEDELEEDAVITTDATTLEFTFDANEQLTEFKTIHRIVRVNTDQAIEEHNKVFIPLSEVFDLVEIHARTISPAGAVVEIDKDNIKELENVEEYGPFKIFAIEGVEKGSDIEYWYTVRKEPTYFGRELIQSFTLSKNVSLKIISPANLIYLTRSYNGFPDLTETFEGDKRVLSGNLERISSLQDEKYAALQANQMRVDYKLSHNTKVSERESFTWMDAAHRVHDIIYSAEEKTLKKIDKLVGGLKLDELPDQQAKILAVENFIKNNFIIKNLASPQLSELSFVLDQKVTDEQGMVRLFAACFNAAGIEHELVLTSDRYRHRFDKDFRTVHFLESYLFYFPEPKLFLAPSSPDLRLGLFPYEFSNNNGLFIKQVMIGEIRTGFGQVKEIPGFPMEEHFDNMKIEVDFPEELTASEISVERTMAGFNATFLQPYYHLIPEADQPKVLDEFLSFVGEDATVSERNITNIDPNESPIDKPMIVNGKLQVRSLVEKAGKDYLLKVGSLIGEQVEMYQDNVRQNPVEIEFPHQYLREITIRIPQGYTVKGLDALDFKIEHGGKEPTMGFVSSYEMEGSDLKVRVFEWYENTSYPLTQFRQFREVINAAADFNKIVLVLEKV